MIIFILLSLLFVFSSFPTSRNPRISEILLGDWAFMSTQLHIASLQSKLRHHPVTQYRTVMSYRTMSQYCCTRNNRRISEEQSNKLMSLEISRGMANLGRLQWEGSALCLSHFPPGNRERARARSSYMTAELLSEKVQPLKCFLSFRSPAILLYNASKYSTHKTGRGVSE